MTENRLTRAALAYTRLGWRIHPCRPREKLPLLRDWPSKATTDQATVARWWHDWPEANIAVATGARSNLFVLDVDGPEGERALADIEHRHGDMPELCPMQWTGSGKGWQAFFSWPEGRTIRNSAGRLGPKLDTRGEGGYVLLPPSVHPSGGVYYWASDRNPGLVPPGAAPQWLIDLLDPPEVPESERAPFTLPTAGIEEREKRYALKALEAELALVAVAPQGRRNDQLNASAHALLRFALDGRLPRDVIERGLLAAAQHAGLVAVEAQRTIASAAKARGFK